jgi:hypothetical protein
VGQTQDAARIALRLPALCGPPTREEAQQVLARAIQFSERGCKSSLKRVKGFWSTWGFA